MPSLATYEMNREDKVAEWWQRFRVIMNDDEF